jgi:hypothetical protein
MLIAGHRHEFVEALRAMAGKRYWSGRENARGGSQGRPLAGGW